MNEAWIDDLRAEPVDLEPRPGFKSELRTTIIDERNGGHSTATRGHRRWWMLGAVAGCIGLLVVDPCFLPTAGFPGTVGDLTGATVGDAVCGRTDDGADLAVVPAIGSGSTTTWDALAVANTVAFVEADDVPHPDLTVVTGDDEPVDADIVGSLANIRWAVTVEPSGTRRMNPYATGEGVGGMEASQQAIDIGQGLPAFESDLTSFPGYGGGFLSLLPHG